MALNLLLGKGCCWVKACPQSPRGQCGGVATLKCEQLVKHHQSVSGESIIPSHRILSFSAFKDSRSARNIARLSVSKPGPSSCWRHSIFLSMESHFRHIAFPAIMAGARALSVTSSRGSVMTRKRRPRRLVSLNSAGSGLRGWRVDAFDGSTGISAAEPFEPRLAPS
jgi:hypothetical protein